MSGRKLNPQELKLHQAALSNTDKMLTSKEAEKLVPDAGARTAAVNFLLGTGMLKVLSNSAGVISFRAVMKKEIEVKKDMTGEEAMVLSHIQVSANEGIWTKHLKAKTELHQTVIDRCLKSLVQKQLVKSIKAVRHPTRKIYMLAHLEPSVELTGGPWYTDNELDTEFIKLLSTACLHYIRDRSFPKSKKDRSAQDQPLYAIGAAPAYPNALQIQHFLSKSKITETQLNVEHVEMLLNVLVLDGEVEKIPAFGAGMWDANVDEDEDENSGSSSEDERAKKRKRKSSEKKSRKRKRKRKDDTESDSDSEKESSGDERPKKKSKKRGKVEANEDSDEDDTREKKKKKKRKAKEDSDDSDDDSDDSDAKRSKKKKKKKSRKKAVSSEDESDTASSESEQDTRRRSSKSKSTRKRSATPQYDLNAGNSGGAFSYRAVRQERVALGWSQAPCGSCPVFDFCKEKGPTNPQECTYYEEWLRNAAIAIE
ncbi:hypothetical protein SERLA73DRAFT_167202 [Serpula lacrymans var. lacrymans S7.3]|uniref:DNA-directed RNA polymerase III subunit RPC6 n=1 Tax=Serpula lacrymans var. lacrymans (strain S7.3) TaxID=936435 RepID=F8PTM2_SERL3|nr:hypothetical protein SERLA73DRAFT_167202 [Serpula lacrymans var. lacrymans S7.3]